MRLQRSVRYGDTVIDFLVRHSDRGADARAAVVVQPDGKVVVTAPPGASIDAIEAAVRARARWICRHVHAIEARRKQVLSRDYVSGESLLYLGRRYRLKVMVVPGMVGRACLQAGFIVVTVPNADRAVVQAALTDWYRGRARQVLSDRVSVMVANRVGVRAAPEVTLRAMRVQWGSCSPRGRLTLNPHLVKAPVQCIDYVVLHELLHLREHNHSPRFYRLLTSIQPDWRQRKERLDALADQILNV